MRLLPLLLLLLLLVWRSGAQRYAERNVLAAPSHDEDEDEDEEEWYDFGEEESPDLYKWNVEQYPHPLHNPRFCNRLRASRVCDPDLVLDRKEADLLDDRIEELFRSTSCVCDRCDSKEDGGIVVGIALLKHLHFPYHVHHAKVIRSFAETLRVRWKLGSCDNDVLIVVATHDRLSYTDVGLATSAHLSVHEAHRIFLENKAKFSASNFSEGLLDIMTAYRGLVRPRGVDSSSSSPVDVGTVVGGIVGSVLLLGLFLFLAVLLYNRRRKDTKAKKDREPNVHQPDSSSSASSSWSKKDIRVLFAPDSARYHPCGTDEKDAGGAEEEDDELDMTLASPDDTSFPTTRLTEEGIASSGSAVTLEKDLEKAAEGLVRTFPSRNDVLVTDM